MPEVLLQYLQLGATGGLFAFFIFQYFQTVKKAQTLVIKDDQRSGKTDDVAETLKQENTKENERLAVIETLFREHCSVQAESFATIHNGLNTQANAIKDLVKAVQDLKIEVSNLGVLFNERVPKK